LGTQINKSVPGAAVHAQMAPPSTAINSFAMAAGAWLDWNGPWITKRQHISSCWRK